MREATGDTTSVGPKKEPSKKTYYYTIKGKEDFFDDEDYPRQMEENELTFAKKTGSRMMIKLDKYNEPCNPIGLFYKPAKLERWIYVNKIAFNQYIMFLKTKNNLFYRQCQRSY